MKRFVICGKSYIACKATEYTHDIINIQGLDLTLCTVPVASDEGMDTWQPSLLKLSKRLCLGIHNSLSSMNLGNDDIVISLEYDRIIRPTDLNQARAYNLHFSNLPKYRGCLTSVWPIRNGEVQAGVSLHELTPGIDDGPIIDQTLFEISDFMNSYDLYRSYNAYAYELYKRNLEDLIFGLATSKSQDESMVSYYKRSSVNYKDIEIVEFNKSAFEVGNYIRSLIFEPYQLPLFHGKKIIDCDRILWRSQNGQMPPHSTVITEDAEHAVISCEDGYLRLKFQSGN